MQKQITKKKRGDLFAFLQWSWWHPLWWSCLPAGSPGTWQSPPSRARLFPGQGHQLGASLAPSLPEMSGAGIHISCPFSEGRRGCLGVLANTVLVSDTMQRNQTILKLWHDIQRHDWDLTQMCFVMSRAAQTHSPSHWCRDFRSTICFSMGVNLWGCRDKG